MRPDERELLEAMYDIARDDGVWSRSTPREVGSHLGMNHKRMWYILGKWSRKGWYDWGVTIDLGWLTDQGKREAE